MKLTLIFALLTVCAPIIAHAQTDDTPAVAALPLAPASAATADGFVWRFAPPVGSRWTMRSFKRTTSVTQMPAMNGRKSQQIKFILIHKMIADYDVLSRDALGATTIRLTLREFTDDLSWSVAGKTMKNTPPKVSGAKPLSGVVLTIKQAPDGKVWGVIGMRGLESSLLFDAATINPVLDKAPTDGYSPKSMSLMANRLPLSPIRPGESWNYKVDSPASLPLTLDVTGTRTLKSLNSTIAVVSDSAQINSSNAPKDVPTVTDMGEMATDYSQLTGAVDGFTRVQRSSGLPLEATSNLTLSGSVTTKISATRGGKTQTWTAPTSLATTTHLVLEPR